MAGCGRGSGLTARLKAAVPSRLATIRLIVWGVSMGQPGDLGPEMPG